MGNWTIASAPTDLQYFQVSASGYATYNSGLTVMAPNTSARTVRLIKPTAEETNALNQLNSFRTQNGVPALIGFDEVAMEVSRAHAQDMAAQGYFSHWDTQGLKPYQRYALDGGTGFTAENLAGGASNWTVAENGFEAEKATNGGHYQTLIIPDAKWAGLGEVAQTVYDQEIVVINAIFDPLSGHVVSPGQANTTTFRILSGSPSYGAFGADPVPTPLTPSQLNSSPFNGPYSMPSPSAAGFSSTNGPLATINFAPPQSGYYYLGPAGGEPISTLVLIQSH
jgi:uncharacterized protein YkwD